MKTTILLVFSGFVLASFDSAESSDYNPKSAELTPAPILVKRVKGDVKATSTSNPSPFSLKVDSKLREGTTITTGPRSEVTLIFSNGSAVAISPESRVRIVEFKQAGGMDLDIEPYGEVAEKPGQGKPLASLGKEPSISKTRIHIFKGTAYARTKKLHKKSTYLMSTPLGVSKVLGTAWRLTNQINRAQRSMRTEVGVAESTIEFDPIDTNGTVNDPVKVQSGRELLVTGTFRSEADFERMDQIDTIEDVDINMAIAMDSRAVDAPNLMNNMPSPADAAVSGQPSTGGGGDGGFFGGGILPGTAGIGVGGGGGGISGGGDDEPEPTPVPTPTPTPPKPVS